jgi:hypothetical protein
MYKMAIERWIEAIREERSGSSRPLHGRGGNLKDAQGLMRHSRASTTQDVYQQLVPESQRKAVRKLTALAGGVCGAVEGETTSEWPVFF